MSKMKECFDLVAKNQNEGKIVAMGSFKECSCSENDECPRCGFTKYIVVRINETGEFLLQCDYGSYLRIDNDLKLQDEVYLEIVDNYHAVWTKGNGQSKNVIVSMKKEEIQNHTIDVLSQSLNIALKEIGVPVSICATEKDQEIILKVTKK